MVFVHFGKVKNDCCYKNKTNKKRKEGVQRLFVQTNLYVDIDKDSLSEELRIACKHHDAFFYDLVSAAYSGFYTFNRFAGCIITH